MKWNTLAHDNQGPEVENLQRFLNEMHCTDEEENPLKTDGDLGDHTAHALLSYQQERGLELTGEFDLLTRKQATSEGFIAFIQAKNYTPIATPRRIRMIVIHTMECLETPEAGENTALWFAGQTSFDPPQASAHYCVDEDSIVQCVRDQDWAWHAGKVNGYSLGIEHAGFAKQTSADWEDDASRAILANSAKLTAKLALLHGIEPRFLTAGKITNDKLTGFTGHVTVNEALYKGKGHTDPGADFPWELYLALVREAM